MRFLAAIVALSLVLSPAAMAAPGAVGVKSEIKGVGLVAQTVLPRSPESGALPDYCKNERLSNLTPVGRQVAKAGWIVTSEAPLGPYQVVTFASGFDPGTSGVCHPRNARISVFKGSRLVALAYTLKANLPLQPDRNVGVVEPVQGGALLVWTGDDIGPPIGELHADRRGVRLTKIAPVWSFCKLKVGVPNIFGKSIHAARTLLIAHGWRPIRHKRQFEDGNDVTEYQVDDFLKHGVVEAAECSGTGYNFCEFDYRNSIGLLTVATAWENYVVVDYGVSCSHRKPPLSAHQQRLFPHD